MYRPYAEVARVTNNIDALHCAQITMIAALETLGMGKLSMEEAERATGFRPGVETWPFAMLRWFGENGLDVVYFDATNLDRLVQEPRVELAEMGASKELIEYLIQISNFEQEAREISRLHQLSNVRIETRLPMISDIRDGLEENWLALVSLDAASLKEKDPGLFNQHLVLASGVDPHGFEIQDSGPPERFDLKVADADLLRALRTPIDSAGTVILIRPRVSA